MKETPADILYRAVHALMIKIQFVVDSNPFAAVMFKQYVPQKEWDQVHAAMHAYYATREGKKEKT